MFVRGSPLHRASVDRENSRDNSSNHIYNTSDGKSAPGHHWWRTRPRRTFSTVHKPSDMHN